MTGEGFKFADLIKPGEGAMAAIKKDVERRAKAEAFTPGRWYGGMGEILKAHGAYFKGSVLPDKYDDVIGPMARCHLNALVACEAHPELRYFTGLYCAGPRISGHSWAVDPEGNVVEVTFPTKGADTRVMRLAEYPHGDDGPPVRGTLGWTPPPTWAYCGLEFDVAFMRRWVDQTDSVPVLEMYGPEELVARPFLKAYTPKGFPIPDDIEMETYRIQNSASLGFGGVDDDAEWAGEEDDDGQE